MMFKEQIKQLRENRQMLQGKLAEESGSDTAICCKIEKGDRRVRKEYIPIIAKLFVACLSNYTAVLVDEKELRIKYLIL
jgi:DNA-binding XRE family transcriptional regulator